MLKTLLVLGITVASTTSLLQSNRLQNTRWSGAIFAPEQTPAILDFKKDTVLALVDDAVIETSAYRVSGDTLFLTKLSGGSPCGSEEGAYRYTIKDNIFKVEVINDACQPRSLAFSPEGYKKL